MKAKVVVRLKEGVLDPQGTAIRRALTRIGHERVTSVRQGKYFEIEFEGETDADALRSQTEEIARKVLSNPIIEDFRIEGLE